jgi:hypothetical protein
MSAAAAAAAANRRRQHALVAAFAGAGAIDATHARTLEELGVRGQAHALQRLRDQEIVRLAGPGRYWVDLPAWQALQQRRKRWLLIVGFIAFVIGLVVSGGLAAWLPRLAH